MATNQVDASVFESDETLWFDNGRWGEAGYAIPNPAGKTWTNNTVISSLVSLCGRSLFELMHRSDVKFSGPPHKQFWYDLHQLLIVARKRLADEAVDDNDSNRLEPKHAKPAPKTFLIYPVPFFGERIRQPDIRRYCEIALLLLSEMMQHSDNEREGYITKRFAGDMGVFIQDILAKMSMKYFGKTRTEVYAEGFLLQDADFVNYAPAGTLLNVEMTEERQPLQWWPTENDLSTIRGLSVTEALMFAKRWPHTPWFDSADGNVRLGGNVGDLAGPAGGASSSGLSTEAVAGAFIPQAGRAP